MMDRQCDGCTKCCDGWLNGVVNGKPFWPGRPCHFASKGGCTIYNDRPENPCKTFHCQWLVNKDVPEWLKPDRANLIIVAREKNGIKYWVAEEAGAKLSVEALSWLIMHCLSYGINLLYFIGRGEYKIGNREFLELQIS